MFIFQRVYDRLTAFLTILALVPVCTFGQTSLSAGDMAIVLVQSDAPDAFEWMSFVDLEANTVIKFSENAIQSDGRLKSNEGTITFTASSAISKGVVQRWYSGTTDDQYSTSGSVAFSASGDQVIAYQESGENKTFLYYAGFAKATTVITSEDPSTNTSYVPSGLSTGAYTVIDMGSTDNYYYKTSNGASGTASELLASIGATSNWTASSDAISSGATVQVSDFSVTVASSNTSIQFTSSSDSAVESTGTYDLTVSITNEDASNATTVDVALTDGSATNGTDFSTYSNETLTFSAGNSTSQTVTLTIMDDTVVEGKETVIFQLQNVSGGNSAEIGSTSQFTLTIRDNELIINEIHADPDATNGDSNGDGTVSSTQDEFVELVNNSGGAMDISDWTISDAVGVKHTFESGTTLMKGQGIVVFAGGTPTGTFGGSITNTAGSLNLNNSGDSITVTNSDGTVVATDTYGSEAGDNQSITRDPDLTGSFMKHSAATGADGSLFSPGTKVDGTTFAEASVTVTELDGGTKVTEGDTTDSYTLVLGSSPSADVTITVSPDAQTVVSPGTVIFTSSDFSTAQTVTVTAVNDATVEGNHTSTISHSVASSDANYNGISISSVTVVVTDNDNPGVTVTEAGGSTAVTEGDTSDYYTVVLQSQPIDTVIISVTASDTNIVVDQSKLAFTSGNYSTAQTVNVSAVDDGKDEENHTSTITHSVSSDDTNYSHITINSVIVTVVDDDTAGITVIETDGSTAVTEGDTSDYYTVVLQSQPTATVTIVLAASTTDISVDPDTLIFSATNYDDTQEVIVTATDDSDPEKPETATISHTVTSSDSIYDGFSVDNISITISDNDVYPLVINEIHYNPSTVQGSDRDFEFLELFNMGSVTAYLTGYTFSKGVTHTFSDSDTIASQSVLVVTGNAESYVESVQWQSGGLKNDGEAVVLISEGGFTVDSVTYGPIEPWPRSPNGDGPSLQLIHPLMANELVFNWAASIEMGGSPGAVQLGNAPPVAVADSYTALEDSTLAVLAPGVLSNDSDWEGKTLRAVLVDSSAHGTVVLDSTGAFIYSPKMNFFGADTFRYVAVDTADSSVATAVALKVVSVNDPPTPFAAVSPSDSLYVGISEETLHHEILFAWTSSTDVDNSVIYRLVGLDSVAFLTRDSLTVPAVIMTYREIVPSLDSIGIVRGQWTVEACDNDTAVMASNGPFEIIFDQRRLSTKANLAVPTSFVLYPNFPNPFNPVTTIRYDLPIRAKVDLTIFDLMGRKVITFVNRTEDAGFRSVQWDGTDDLGRSVSAGVYLYQIQAGEFSQTRKMLLLK
ncbi:MAG: lamin tail domain-containing protein [Candidatus Marinimicrobia bacterium]|nr:lamin tail domain-containing protein [Candidatus Neomarinimicrobiota bacterium]